MDTVKVVIKAAVLTATLIGLVTLSIAFYQAAAHARQGVQHTQRQLQEEVSCFSSKSSVQPSVSF